MCVVYAKETHRFLRLSSLLVNVKGGGHTSLEGIHTHDSVVHQIHKFKMPPQPSTIILYLRSGDPKPFRPLTSLRNSWPLSHIQDNNK